ncbi:kinase-like domain-containing protein [Chaetomidium leptoderma]|uniref:Kinase-like domain-containing protein n=1 Tax=Chaetomidium leptoderma TaxID=669021 RepID=A0AAN6VGQ1_9PEZI|nr:kinase-like domain-containing protein [Chaetomidium leptoderma]
MWWDDDTVEQTVTKQFVSNRLIPQEADRLDQPLSFGDSLTDCTYWEWIDEKAKKIFLVLADLGLPEKIFGLIDNSFDDEDLPIAFDEVARLALTSSKDEKTERKFYNRQFHYLWRRLDKGEHVDYEDDEVIPLDVADKKHAAKENHHVDRVTLPNQPSTMLSRCRVPLGPGHLSWAEFIGEINGIRDVQNEHLLSYWASYTHQGYGYILFTAAPEFSLKSLFTTMPSCLKNLDKKVRRRTVLYWVRCLVDTVCFFHNRDLSHGNIKPSTVMFSNDNLVFFSGFTRFHADILKGVTDNTSFDKEAYDYAAPEKLFKPASSPPTSISRSSGHSNNPTTIAQAPAPDPNHQAADIFSLGCVILELLSLLFKKHGRPFAAHRAAKRRSAGRGGAVPDSSFHKNLDQLESWMVQRVRDASKKDDPVFRGIKPILHVVEQMLSYDPLERPTANEVQTKMYQILAESCGILEPHCADRWDFGMEGLTLGSSPLTSASSSGSMPIQAARKSGSQDGELERSGNRGSGGSFRTAASSSQEAETERPVTRARNGSTDSEKSLRHFFSRDKTNQAKYGSQLRVTF